MWSVLQICSAALKLNGQDYTLCRFWLDSRGIYAKKNYKILQDIAFKTLRNVCDQIFKKFYSKGIRTEVKANPVISVNEEDALWNKKNWFEYSTGSVANSIFIMGRTCAWGEARNLTISQIVRETSLVDGKHIGFYSYTEFCSINSQGGFGMLNMQKKSCPTTWKWV